MGSEVFGEVMINAFAVATILAGGSPSSFFNFFNAATGERNIRMIRELVSQNSIIVIQCCPFQRKKCDQSVHKCLLYCYTDYVPQLKIFSARKLKQTFFLVISLIKTLHQFVYKSGE